jgi:hypothetical protein
MSNVRNGRVIGRLEKTVVDCPDPRALAVFYAAVLGAEVAAMRLAACASHTAR